MLYKAYIGLPKISPSSSPSNISTTNFFFLFKKTENWKKIERKRQLQYDSIYLLSPFLSCFQSFFIFYFLFFYFFLLLFFMRKNEKKWKGHDRVDHQLLCNVKWSNGSKESEWVRHTHTDTHIWKSLLSRETWFQQ